MALTYLSLLSWLLLFTLDSVRTELELVLKLKVMLEEEIRPLVAFLQTSFATSCPVEDFHLHLLEHLYPGEVS